MSALLRADIFRMGELATTAAHFGCSAWCLTVSLAFPSIVEVETIIYRLENWEKEYLLHLDFDLFSFMNMWTVGKHFSSSKVLPMPCRCKPAAGAFQRDQSSVQRGSFKWPAWESFYLLSTFFPIQTGFLFAVDDFVAQVVFIFRGHPDARALFVSGCQQDMQSGEAISYLGLTKKDVNLDHSASTAWLLKALRSHETLLENSQRASFLID